MDKDPRGALYLGYIIKIGHWTLYHSGDTIHFDGMEDILSSYHIDLSFLPINGADPPGRYQEIKCTGSGGSGKIHQDQMDYKGHYDMFEFNTAMTLLNLKSLQTGRNRLFRILRLGERFSLTL